MKSSRNRQIIHQPSPKRKTGSMFSILPIFRNLIAVAAFSGIYYYIFIASELYPDYDNTAFWILKLLIAYNILSGATRSIFAPLFTLAAGISVLYVNITTHVPYFLHFVDLATADGWQLIGVGVVGLLLTLIVKL